MNKFRASDRFETHFPLLFMERQFEGMEALNASLADFTRECERTRVSCTRPNLKQYHAGFSTDIDFLKLDHPSIPVACDMIADAFRSYMSRLESCGLLELGGSALKDFQMTMFGWSVILRRNEWICPHSHTGSGGFTGVYYLEVPPLKEPEGCIEFINPAGRYTDVRIRAAAETLRIMPRPGRMLLFPSNYIHLVYPFDGDGERIALGFTVEFTVE